MQVSNGVRHPLGRPALGFFDIVNERILIRSREVIPSLVSGTPFAAIPIGEFYESIVVHEIIHGALDQNIRWHVMGHTAGEYLAYALQIESLSPSARDTILQHVANRVNTDAFVFTDILLSMDPFFFAAQAYQHFKATSDSCATVFALLNGEAPFISAPLY